MPTLTIDPSSFGEGRSIEAPGGGRLLDLCDEARAPIPFSCRSATCGTCRVRVREGAGLLEPSDAAEKETLEIFGGPPDTRLACVARVRAGAGQVHLALADDDRDAEKR